MKKKEERKFGGMGTESKKVKGEREWDLRSIEKWGETQ